jgi:HB1, ASXL, restriction endonuclease HTH domain
VRVHIKEKAVKKNIRVGGRSSAQVSGDAAPGAGAAKVEPGANPGAEDATVANVPPQRAARAIRVIGAKPAPAPEAPVVVAAGSPVPPKAKKGAKAQAPKQAKPKRMSGLDACARVLAESKEPMGAKAMVEQALKRGLWKSGGKTPEATVYAAIIRDIAARGRESRFKKAARGLFEFVKR